MLLSFLVRLKILPSLVPFAGLIHRTRHALRRGRVDCKALLRLRFAEIDLMEGSGVDQSVGKRRVEHGLNLLRHAHIHLGSSRCRHYRVPQHCSEIGGKLAASPSYDYTHVTSPSV